MNERFLADISVLHRNRSAKFNDIIHILYLLSVRKRLFIESLIRKGQRQLKKNA